MGSAATVSFPTERTPGFIHAFGAGLDARSSSQTPSTVFIIDDDIATRYSLGRLITSNGWQAQACASPREFLAQPHASVPSAVILAFSSSNSNGLEIQKRIAREYPETPIIVVADYKDIPTTVQAIKAGAIDFLEKPLREESLLAAIRQSLVRSRAALDRRTEMHDVRNCHASLSPREQQVLALVVSGLLNKQVGAELGISEITVKAHRGQVMRKMKAASFAHLVSMALKLRIPIYMTPGVV